MKKLLLLALLLPSYALAQNTKEPLKCGQYQHVEPAHVGCDYALGTLGMCDRWVQEQCVEDIHFVTEREWQELLKRIEKAEAYRKAALESTRIAEQCLHELGVCSDRIEMVRSKVQEIIKRGGKP